MYLPQFVLICGLFHGTMRLISIMKLIFRNPMIRSAVEQLRRCLSKYVEYRCPTACSLARQMRTDAVAAHIHENQRASTHGNTTNLSSDMFTFHGLVVGVTSIVFGYCRGHVSVRAWAVRMELFISRLAT